MVADGFAVVAVPGDLDLVYFLFLYGGGRGEVGVEGVCVCVRVCAG